MSPVSTIRQRSFFVPQEAKDASLAEVDAQDIYLHRDLSPGASWQPLAGLALLATALVAQSSAQQAPVKWENLSSHWDLDLHHHHEPTGVTHRGTQRILSGQWTPDQEQQAQLFLKLALGRGDQSPRLQARAVVEEYVRTDFGQEMVGKVLQDYATAQANGYLDQDGELTIEGQFANFTPFRIVRSTGSAQATLRQIELPDQFASHFAHSGQAVHPLAILHHEFGHTQFGTPATAQDIVTDQHGSRLHVDHEMAIVNKYENPVRLRYGFDARQSYTNHLGEKSTLR